MVDSIARVYPARVAGAQNDIFGAFLLTFSVKSGLFAAAFLTTFSAGTILFNRGSKNELFQFYPYASPTRRNWPLPFHVSYTLRKEAIEQKRQSWKNATENGFKVGTYEEMIPDADLVCNLTPDKQHHNVIPAIMKLMKKGAALSYSHGFNIVEEGQEIRKDITVIMVAPKGPGSEVRSEYVRGFGMPCLIAVRAFSKALSLPK